MIQNGEQYKNIDKDKILSPLANWYAEEYMDIQKKLHTTEYYSCGIK